MRRLREVAVRFDHFLGLEVLRFDRVCRVDESSTCCGDCEEGRVTCRLARHAAETALYRPPHVVSNSVSAASAASSVEWCRSRAAVTGPIEVSGYFAMRITELAPPLLLTQ